MSWSFNTCNRLCITVSYESWELVTCGRNLLRLLICSSHYALYALPHNSPHEVTYVSNPVYISLKPEVISTIIVSNNIIFREVLIIGSSLVLWHKTVDLKTRHNRPQVQISRRGPKNHGQLILFVGHLV